MVSTYLVGYDLRKYENSNSYQELIEAIKRLGRWWHYLDSTWLVKTELSSSQIVERLRNHIDANDRLLVIEVKPHTASGWLPAEAWDWIPAS